MHDRRESRFFGPKVRNCATGEPASCGRIWQVTCMEEAISVGPVRLAAGERRVGGQPTAASPGGVAGDRAHRANRPNCQIRQSLPSRRNRLHVLHKQQFTARNCLTFPPSAGYSESGRGEHFRHGCPSGLGSGNRGQTGRWFVPRGSGIAGINISAGTCFTACCQGGRLWGGVFTQFGASISGQGCCEVFGRQP